MNEDANSGSGVLGAAVGLTMGIGAPIAIHKGMTSDTMINYMDEQYMSKDPSLLAKAGAFYNDRVATAVRMPMAYADTINDNLESKGGFLMTKGEPNYKQGTGTAVTTAEKQALLSDKILAARKAYRNGEGEYKKIYKGVAQDLDKEIGGATGKAIGEYVSKLFKL
jgi:hypothetical protein